MPEEKKLEPGPVLVVNSSERRPTGFSFTSQLTDEINSSLASIPLLACCFATGLTDGTLYNGQNSSTHL